MSPKKSLESSEAPQCAEKSPDETKYITEQYGVWEILFGDESHQQGYLKTIHDFPQLFPSLYRLLLDVYFLSPELFPVFAFCQIWNGCQEAIKMHFSTQVLRAVEQCLKDGVADYPAVAHAVTLRLAIAAFASFISWYSARVMRKLQRRVTFHFQVCIMKAKLGHDLAGTNSPAAKISVSADEAWHAFMEILYYVSTMMTVISHLALILHLSGRDNSGPLFAVLCILQPVISTSTSKSLWGKVCIVRQNNKDQQRMEALINLTSSQYRLDVISNDLQKYILEEYRRASDRLGDLSSEPVWAVYNNPDSPSRGLVLTLLGDLPLVYCAALALWNPQHTSFASIAILQQSSSFLSRWVSSALRTSQRFRNAMKQIQDLYASIGDTKEVTKVSEKQEQIEDATLQAGEGVGFELQNVSFTYPGSKVSKEALSNINLSIKPGQFVVLVGANGSGKSTLLKLLCRLYNPSASASEDDKTPGQILIDSLPAQSYTESSLRRTMAVLSQDNLIYPGFSLGENVGMGYTPQLYSGDRLDEAATKAGAKEVITRMKEGMTTVLDPRTDWYSFNVREQDEGHPLKKVMEEMERPTEVSGGEKQRIVAARTFMRFNSGKIRFLAVDEPSSALDAAGEELLLDNLLKERQGKTIIFVTHRFGKLTKHADLILCMKEGKIIESGTHKELIKITDGEYKKLYDIQASPFRDEPENTASSPPPPLNIAA